RLGLEQKTIEAVRQWKFDPAMKDGKPVAVAINVEVDFRLYLVFLLAKTAADCAAVFICSAGISTGNSFLQIHMSDILNRMPQKPHSQRAKLLYGVSSKKFHAGQTPALILGGCRNWSYAQQFSDDASRRFGGIHDGQVRR